MDQLGALTRLVPDVLGPDLIGMYLHGSAVAGGLRPASDLDVLVVTTRRTDHRRRAALLHGLFGVSGMTATLRPVELTVVARPDVRPWRYPPVCDLQYGEWLREQLESDGAPPPAPMPDLALLITMVLAADRPLAGPPPARVLDPVPHADLVRATAAGVPDLVAELDDDTRNVVLTLARTWSTLATGRIRTKDDAADWARRRVPPEHRPVLDHARDLYLRAHYTQETWPDELRAGVRPCVDAMLAQIDHLAIRCAVGRARR